MQENASIYTATDHGNAARYSNLGFDLGFAQDCIAGSVSGLLDIALLYLTVTLNLPVLQESRRLFLRVRHAHPQLHR